jgi:hypothetical protein
MPSLQSILSRGNNRLRALIQEVILDKNLIKTGDLHRSIDAEFREEDGIIKIKIGAIYYYKYLDDGTRYIEARNITKDTTEHPTFKNIMDDVAADFVEYLIEKPD